MCCFNFDLNVPVAGLGMSCCILVEKILDFITYLYLIAFQDEHLSGSEVTMSSSETGSEHNTTRVLGMTNFNITKDGKSFLSSLGQSPLAWRSKPDASAEIYDERLGSQSEWSGGSLLDASTNDSLNSPREALLGERSQDTSEI